MALKDVAGVFSRYFIVGFFLPAFFTTLILAHVVDEQSLPALYLNASGGAQILIIGGAGLFVGLVASGLHESVLRLYEGYPLEGARDKRGFNLPYRVTIKRWQDRFDAHATVKSQPTPSRARTDAAQTLARLYPATREQLLPTRFGNAVRSFERHPRSRYGLDGVVIWPRIALLLTDQEQQIVADAQTDVAFFVNASVFAIVLGCLVIADAIAHGALPFGLCWLYALPFVVAWAAYRLSVGAAVRWGDTFRAVVDVHRLDLYARLGVRTFASDEDERRVANAVNRMLLFGEPIPDELRVAPPPTGGTTS